MHINFIHNLSHHGKLYGKVKFKVSKKVPVVDPAQCLGPPGRRSELPPGRVPVLYFSFFHDVQVYHNQLLARETHSFYKRDDTFLDR